MVIMEEWTLAHKSEKVGQGDLNKNTSLSFDSGAYEPNLKSNFRLRNVPMLTEKHWTQPYVSNTSADLKVTGSQLS